MGLIIKQLNFIKKTSVLIPCLIFPVIFFSLVFSVSAHSGRTDSKGCHTCKTNCPSYGLSYGEYHCDHNSKYTPETISTNDSDFGWGWIAFFVIGGGLGSFYLYDYIRN